MLCFRSKVSNAPDYIRLAAHVLCPFSVRVITLLSAISRDNKDYSNRLMIRGNL